MTRLRLGRCKMPCPDACYIQCSLFGDCRWSILLRSSAPAFSCVVWPRCLIPALIQPPGGFKNWNQFSLIDGATPCSGSVWWCGLALSNSSVPIHSFQSVKDSIFVQGEEGRKASATSLGPPPDLFVLFGQVAPHWGAAGRHWSHKILASGPWRMDKHTLYTYLAMSIWQVNYKYLLGLTQLNYPWSGDNKPQRCCDVGKCSAQ